MDNIYNNINRLYTKGGFLERYGKDVFITIFILLIFFIIFSYFLVMTNLKSIKSNWITERCNPSVMPFAGIINAPPGVNKLDFTKDNFNGCLNTTLKNTISYSLSPIYSVMHVIVNFFEGMVKSLDHVREVFNRLRTELSSVSTDIYGRSLNLTTPIIQLLINVKDMLFKTQGVMTAGLFSIFGGYLSIKAIIGSVIEIITTIIIAMVSFLIILWIIPFTWGVAALLTPLVGTLIGLLSYTVIKSKNILKVTPSRGIPTKPRCFDENTIITLSNKSLKYIKDLDVGDILSDGSVITAIMKSSTDDHTFYNLNGVIVTGTHRVYHKNKGWILVKEHPNSVLIEQYYKQFMYCVGTDNKLFTINGIVFGDWDELSIKELTELYKNARHILPDNFKISHIHKFLDSGFVKGTKIELIYNKIIQIEDININDVLKHGEKVMSIVKIDAKDLIGIYDYHIEGKIIRGGPNMDIIDENLGTIHTTKINNKIHIDEIHKDLFINDYIYHLVTDKGTFYINGIQLGDYNSTTDKYLNERKMKKN